MPHPVPEPAQGRPALRSAGDRVFSDLGGPTMGTTWSARLAAPAGLDLRQAHARVQDALDGVVAQMSTWLPGSDLCRFNRAPEGWHALPAECFEVLQCAWELARETGGAYDPTVAPLVDLWGFGPAAPRTVPASQAEVDAALARVGWYRLRLDPAARRAWRPADAALDFSSIAKGYGVDRAAAALDALGVANYLVEVGGELLGRGRRPDGRPWRVAVELPDGSGPAAVLALDGLSVATSGDYRRYFEAGGRRYSHTLDPRTGRPVEHGLASVAVAAQQCMRADAQATALAVLGLEAGMEHARRHGLAALFVSHAGDGFDSRATPAFEALLTGE